MSRATFDLSVFVAAEPAVVGDFLGTLDEYPRIHPLITRVQRLPRTVSSADPQPDHYRIHDRMRVGPVTVSFSYRVEMAVTAAGEIVSDAYQFPCIHLHNVTTCTPEKDGTLVHEHVDITAPRPLLPTVHRKGSQAHRIMFERLKAVLETG